MVGRRALLAAIAYAVVGCASVGDHLERGLHPVYNVVFDGTQAREKATLLDEQPATATWFIDEPSELNAVEGSERNVSGDIRESLVR